MLSKSWTKIVFTKKNTISIVLKERVISIYTFKCLTLIDDKYSDF